jgi:hypothetical protein
VVVLQIKCGGPQTERTRDRPPRALPATSRAWSLASCRALPDGDRAVGQHTVAPRYGDWIIRRLHVGSGETCTLLRHAHWLQFCSRSCSRIVGANPVVPGDKLKEIRASSLLKTQSFCQVVAYIYFPFLAN